MNRRIVIVGAGSAGCVLAARLSERESVDVLLLEAGPDYADEPLPRELANGGRNAMVHHDWGYSHQATTTQRVRFRLPRGRVVGGSSAVNTCIALRGQPWDYDEWAARGLSDWSWDQCLPAFLRLEQDLDAATSTAGVNAEHHNAHGNLPIRRHSADELDPWQSAFLEACDLLGYPKCADSNAPGSHGAGPHAMNKVGGRRISAAEAWLTPAVRRRENLRIQPDTTVHQIHFEGRKAVALGAVVAGETLRIEADEIIVCAGAIGSPGLLLRSGIGGHDDLNRLGVKQVAELAAVGARLLDHPGAALFFRPRFCAPTHRTHALIQTVLRYGGPVHGRDNDMILQPGSKVPLARYDMPFLSLMTSVGKPRGTGRIVFTSTDPNARPKIDSMLLEHHDDRAMAADAMERAYALSQTKPMRELATLLWPRPRTMRSTSRVEAWIRGACDSGYHPSGTVPMGSDDDPSAATDGQGRVRGVSGLRVVDASLLPTIPSANIHLTVLMMAERIAQWI